MGPEQFGVATAALELGLIDRVNEHVTVQQFRIVERNLHTEGIIDYLDGGDAPWDAFLKIMDGITFPYPEPGTVFDLQNPPKHATIVIPFVGPAERERFRGLCRLAWSGIRGAGGPDVREVGLRELIISNLTYPDVATLGRVGTVLLQSQYGDALGRNSRLTTAHTVRQILDSGVLGRLPHELQDFIKAQLREFGDMAIGMVLSSGRLGLVGMALRLALGYKNLEVQRPKGDRPYIEEGAVFYDITNEALPISGTSLGRRLKEQMSEPIEELKQPWRQHNPIKGIVDLGEIIWELGIKEGAVATVRALGTVAVALEVANRGMAEDKALLAVMRQRSAIK